MTGERLADALAAVDVNKASRRCGSCDSSWLVGGLAWGGNRRLQWEVLLVSPPPLVHTPPAHHVGVRREREGGRTLASLAVAAAGSRKGAH